MWAWQLAHSAFLEHLLCARPQAERWARDTQRGPLPTPCRRRRATPRGLGGEGLTCTGTSFSRGRLARPGGGVQRPCSQETAVFVDRREVSEEPDRAAHARRGGGGHGAGRGGPTLPCALPPAPRLPSSGAQSLQWTPRGPLGGAEGHGGQLVQGMMWAHGGHRKSR